MKIITLQTLFPLLSALIVGLTKVAYADTVIHDKSFTPDAILRVSSEERKQSCVPTKEILVVNGTSPGPELRLPEGKTVWIRVYNDIHDQNITMHWHGLTLAVAPFSDGTPEASQWPIPPLHYFDYEIHVPVGMAGTYFYHSHVGLQALSCTGPLTVEDANKPPYHYDGERIIFIQDVMQDTDEVIEAGQLTIPVSYDKPQAMVLINGKGAGPRQGDTFCNDTLSVINVDPGKTYRLRVIGANGVSFDTIGIEGHEVLTVIEADGHVYPSFIPPDSSLIYSATHQSVQELAVLTINRSYTQKHNTSFLQIGAGQRFSVLLDTLSDPDKQYYLLQLETREFGPLIRSYAVINYGPRSTNSSPPFYPPVSAPLVLPPTEPGFLDYQLRPHHSHRDFPTAAEVTRRVNITLYLDVHDGGLTYLINGYTWNETVPKEPYLVSLYKNDSVEWPSMERALENDGLDPIARAFPARMDEVIEIVIQNSGSARGKLESHPWHAHGAHVWDLGSGNGVYDCVANEAKWANSTGKPILRDTSLVYKYGAVAGQHQLSGWRAWRLRIKQPGVWMVHCHLLPHMVWGMQTVWVMGNSTDVLRSVPRPQLDGYLDYGGSAYGNGTHYPSGVVEFFNVTEWAGPQ